MVLEQQFLPWTVFQCSKQIRSKPLVGSEKSPQSLGKNNLNSENAEESHYSNKDVSLNFRTQESGFPVIKLTYTKFLFVRR